MRARRLLFPLIAVTLVACSGADDPDRTTTQLTCTGGATCTLELPEAAAFTVTLVSSECIAVETVVELTSPEEEVLLDNACAMADGMTWDYGPYPAGTQIALEITADQFASPPSLLVSGSYEAGWEIRFEDGFDTDNDDLILSIVAVPAAS